MVVRQPARLGRFVRGRRSAVFEYGNRALQFDIDELINSGFRNQMSIGDILLILNDVRDTTPSFPVFNDGVADVEAGLIYGLDSTGVIAATQDTTTALYYAKTRIQPLGFFQALRTGYEYCVADTATMASGVTKPSQVWVSGVAGEAGKITTTRPTAQSAWRVGYIADTDIDIDGAVRIHLNIEEQEWSAIG